MASELGILDDCHMLLCKAHWFGESEGPFTVLAKVARANCLSGSEICRELFGRPLVTCYSDRHPRSLLDTRWMNTAHTDGASVLAITQRASLHEQLGSLTTAIAGDRHLRFCQQCWEVGYQTAVCQIDLLRQCPLHLCSIIEACPRCKTPFGPYALTTELPSFSVACAKCRWEARSRWRIQDDVEGAYRSIDDAYRPIWEWVSRLGRGFVKWQMLDQWRCAVHFDLSARRRCAAHALRHVVEFDGASDHFFREPVLTFDGTSHGELSCGTWSPEAEYVGLRNDLSHFLRITNHRLDGGSRDISPTEFDRKDDVGVSVWRSRFEVGLRIRQVTLGDDQPVPLYDFGATRYHKDAFTLDDEKLVPRELWCAYAGACLIADIQVARLYLRKLSELQVLSVECQRVGWMRLYAYFAPLLDHTIYRWPPTVSRFEALASDGSRRSLITVALLADGEVM